MQSWKGIINPNILAALEATSEEGGIRAPEDESIYAFPEQLSREKREALKEGQGPDFVLPSRRSSEQVIADPKDSVKRHKKNNFSFLEVTKTFGTFIAVFGIGTWAIKLTHPPQIPEPTRRKAIILKAPDNSYFIQDPRGKYVDAKGIDLESLPVGVKYEGAVVGMSQEVIDGIHNTFEDSKGSYLPPGHYSLPLSSGGTAKVRVQGGRTGNAAFITVPYGEELVFRPYEGVVRLSKSVRPQVAVAEPQ